MKLALTGCLIVLVGCGEAPSALRSHAQPVIGGKPSPAGDDGVVVIRTDREMETSVCSGSLLAPNLLLTARHCLVADYPAGQIRCQPDGSLMLPSDGEVGDSVAAEQVNVFAGGTPIVDGTNGLPGGEPVAIGTRIITTTWPSVCRDDLGLVVLDRPIALPTLDLDLTNEVAKGDALSVVGYGVAETSNTGELWSSRRRRDGVAVKYVDTLPDTFVLGRSVCKGDSGGPALHPESGGIVGVYSLGFPGDDATACSSDTALNYFVRLERYEPLLREAFTAAGQSFPEPVDESGGAGGAANAPAEAGAGGASPEPSGEGGAEAASPPAKRSPRKDSCALPTAPPHGSSAGWLLGVGWLLRRRWLRAVLARARCAHD